MAVKSSDIAEPFILNDASDIPTMTAAKVGAVLAEGIQYVCLEAAGGKIAMLVLVSSDEQAEVVRLMLKSAKEALDLRDGVEAAVGGLIKPTEEVANADNG